MYSNETADVSSDRIEVFCVGFLQYEERGRPLETLRSGSRTRNGFPFLSSSSPNLLPLLRSLHIRPTSPPVLCILLSFVITGYYRNYASACSRPAACYWLPAHHVTQTAGAWNEIQHGAKLLNIGHWPSAEYRNVKLNKQNWAACV